MPHVDILMLEIPRTINGKLRVIQNPESELEELSTPGPTPSTNGTSTKKSQTCLVVAQDKSNRVDVAQNPTESKKSERF